MQTCASVGVNLSDLGLNVTLVDGPTSIFKHFDGLTKMLHSLLVGLFPELVVAFFLKGGKLVFNLLVIVGVS